jgi:hypothetical protein
MMCQIGKKNIHGHGRSIPRSRKKLSTTLWKVHTALGEISMVQMKAEPFHLLSNNQQNDKE